MRSLVKALPLSARMALYGNCRLTQLAGRTDRGLRNGSSQLIGENALDIIFVYGGRDVVIRGAGHYRVVEQGSRKLGRGGQL